MAGNRCWSYDELVILGDMRGWIKDKFPDYAVAVSRLDNSKASSVVLMSTDIIYGDPVSVRLGTEWTEPYTVDYNDLTLVRMAGSMNYQQYSLEDLPITGNDVKKRMLQWLQLYVGGEITETRPAVLDGTERLSVLVLRQRRMR